MMRLRHDRARGMMAGLALALYLAGTNYCLVGGVASSFGARVPCMASAKTASGSSRDGTTPVHTPPLPCCMAVAPVLATPGVEIPASPIAFALPASPEAEDAAPVLASWFGYRVTRDAGPPPPLSRAPQSPRAPPL